MRGHRTLTLTATELLPGVQGLNQDGRVHAQLFSSARVASTVLLYNNRVTEIACQPRFLPLVGSGHFPGDIQIDLVQF